MEASLSKHLSVQAAYMAHMLQTLVPGSLAHSICILAIWNACLVAEAHHIEELL